jgi:N-acetylglucosaminyldiphosphoundecaprenol N-acetyl-beta-D-mannosaminyltransferase
MSKLQYAQEYGPPARKQHGAAVDILGVKVDALRLDDVLGTIARTINARERAIVTYANIHALNLAYELSWFRAFLNRSDIVFCDGFGVKWGAWLLGAHIPERFTAPDWMARLCATACQDDFSVFFLGARPGVARRAAEQLRMRFPELQIAGIQHGHFDKNPGSAENEAVIQAINAARPNLLIVGFGMPLQERWLLENWSRLEVNVALTVGAVFDYLSGEVQRAPAWMTDHGLEWLGRLLIEPRRLWRRYLIGNPLFLWRVLRQRFGLLRIK